MKFINKSFSENIVFLDTEFSTDTPETAELLSIGMVKVNGEELYIELEYDGEISDWVKENVIPFLKGEAISKDDAIKKIIDFLGNEKPYPVAYVYVYDMVYIYRLFGSIDKAPFKWPPIDFASILFANGIDPEGYDIDDDGFFQKIGIDASKYHEHNALDDAKLLREVYLKLTE